MVEISDDQFESFIAAAVSDIPERFARNLNNVAFRVDDDPSPQQLRAGGILHSNATSLGLYQGVPLPARTSGYSGMVPDVITIFKRPHQALARDSAELQAMVHQTVWHEVAHYFGLNHGQIRALER